MTPPPGWLEEHFDCPAACDACECSFSTLYRKDRADRVTYLCLGCLETHLAVESYGG